MSPGFSGILSAPAPLQRLRMLQDRLGVTSRHLQRINDLSDVFLSETEAFAHSLYEQLHDMQTTRMILDHGPSREKMIRIWSRWYASFFHNQSTENFLAAQWRSGLRHVASGVDHRWISLAYALARVFIHQVATKKLDSATKGETQDLLDRLVDLCLLVETDAFITSLSRCDHEIIRGIAHQVRNPLTIIGGNVMRLLKQTPKSDPVHDIYASMLTETSRLERMVRNVTTYNEVFQREPGMAFCPLEPALQTVLDELRPEEGIAVYLQLSSKHPAVFADPKDLRIVFYHLLQNSLENLTKADYPELRVISAQNVDNDRFLDIRIFNNGPVPDPDSLEKLFTPFYSTKALGTGFGLPIARLAVSKNQGHLSLIPEPNKGTTCLVTLPLAEPSENHP